MKSDFPCLKNPNVSVPKMTPTSSNIPNPKKNIQKSWQLHPQKHSADIRSWLPSVTPEPPCLGRMDHPSDGRDEGHRDLTSSLKDPQGPVDLAQKIKASNPGNSQKFRSSLDGTVPNLWDRLERFPNCKPGGIVFITPLLSPLISQVKPGPSSKYQVPPHGRQCPLSQCKTHPPESQLHHTRRKPTKSQVNGRDHGRFVVLLMKQPEKRRFFYGKIKFWDRKFQLLRFDGQNLTIFLGCLLNHPLKIPCI